MVIQLLGSDPEWMALDAATGGQFVAAWTRSELRLPRQVVNRHGGGAMLLAHPEQLSRIVSSVRAAVPAGIAVTAKMRVGVSDTSLAIDCATALAKAALPPLSCTPERVTMPTGRRPTGSGSPVSTLPWTCRSWPTEKSGQWPTGSGAGRSAAART